MYITLYTLYPSKNPKKKYDVYIKKRGKVKKVSFGAKGYSDYTIHKDYDRMKRYRTRHKHDKIKDPSKSGFWSWWVLWNKPSKKKSLQDTTKRFRLKKEKVEVKRRG